MTEKTEKFLLIDIDLCARCYSCEIACKQENNIGVGPRWRRITTLGPRRLGEEDLHLDFVPVSCIHCDDPTCAYFCPTDAISKRKDGVVVIDEEKCNGCQLCIYGCPHGNMSFDPERNVAGKCNLCMDRIDYGLEPSCVQHCFCGALQWVNEKELAEITQEMHTTRSGKLCYRSTKWKLSPMA